MPKNSFPITVSEALLFLDAVGWEYDNSANPDPLWKNPSMAKGWYPTPLALAITYYHETLRLKDEIAQLRGRKNRKPTTKNKTTDTDKTGSADENKRSIIAKKGAS